VSVAQGVSVPVQGVAAADQLQPGVVHVVCVSVPHVGTIVPVHEPDDQMHPWLEQLVWSAI
jgi:hypothetical protein